MFLNENGDSQPPAGFTACIPGFAPHDLTRVSETSFDIVVAFDVIEHLPEHDGYLLLYEMDRISVEFSCVYTPSGFLWQPPSINNPFNAHISGWQPSTLRQLGWTRVTGIFGFRQLMGPYGRPRFSASTPTASKLLSALMSASQVLARPLPSLAHSFYAKKTSKGARIGVQEFESGE
jgi:hypothetical protein